MPIINRKYEDGRIAVKARFRGIRRYKLFSWIPYLTGSEPKMHLQIVIKDARFILKSIKIECDHTKTISETLFPENYDWQSTAFTKNGLYEAILPQLDESGVYKYTLTVQMKYGKEIQNQIISNYKIMSTGHVYDKGIAILNFISLIVGGLLVEIIHWIF